MALQMYRVFKYLSEFFFLACFFLVCVRTCVGSCSVSGLTHQLSSLVHVQFMVYLLGV